VKRFGPACSNIPLWLVCVTVTATSLLSLVLLDCLLCSTLGTLSMKEKKKYSIHYTLDQYLEDTLNKIIPSSNNNKMNNRWSQWSHGYKSGREIVTKKKSPIKNDECRFRFSNYYIAKTIKKKGDCMCFQNVMSGTMKHVLVRKARGNSFVVYATYKDCINKWSELYLRRYIFDLL
jgi:hypothetical protein